MNPNLDRASRLNPHCQIYLDHTTTARLDILYAMIIVDVRLIDYDHDSERGIVR